MKSAWIRGPWTDLACFSFGWLPALAAFLLAAPGANRPLLVTGVLFFNFLHRHLTLPLAYADPEEFRRRRIRYVLLPLFFAALSAALLSHSREAFMILAALAVLWTMFHSVQQKIGLLRIYARKAGGGAPWADRLFVWSWFAALLLHLGASPAIRAQAASLAVAGRWLARGLDAAGPAVPILAWSALALALVSTALFLRQGFTAAKALFALSILALYGIFLHDLVMGYAVFAFSHAVEYLAFVNLYARKKFLARPPESSLLARAVRQQALVFGAFIVLVGGTFVAWNWISRPTLQIYIIGSGFLHFLYDGWLWKVRHPEVGRPLDLAYEAPT